MTNLDTYSDLYKDLNGFRPDLTRFRALSLDEQQEEIEHVGVTLAGEIAADAAAEEAAYEAEDHDYEPVDIDDDSDYDPYTGGMIGGDSDLMGEW